jgi:hypothetical protein
MVSVGMLRLVALVRTYVSEEPGASFIKVTKIDALGTTQAATSNRRTLRRRNNPEDTIRLDKNITAKRQYSALGPVIIINELKPGM